MKRFVVLSFSVLILAGCAYTPNIDASQQLRPTYADDLATCQHKLEDIQHRLYGPFGLISYLYGQAHYTADEIHEAENLVSLEAQHKFIDDCMKNKEYTVNR